MPRPIRRKVTEKIPKLDMKMVKECKHHNHIPYSEMPAWMGDNEFILTHHRPELGSFMECFRSVFAVHSETGNIWTHLLGVLGFVILTIVFYIKPFCDQCNNKVAFIDNFIFIFFFVGAITCLGFSMIFHTVLCHSEQVYKIFSKFDYAGISILTLGSFIPWIYYGFYCDLTYQIVYISIITVLTSGTLFVTMVDKFASAAYRPVRALLFVCIGLFAVVPFTHFLVLHGWGGAQHLAAVQDMLVMACLYISGAVLYGARIPERFMQGRCDLWFQSHQIFHVLVVAGAVVQFFGLKSAALYRLTQAEECG